MSFGFSIGDFIGAIELANKLRKEFVNAPAQFKAIADEVRSLAIVLQDTDVIFSDKDLNGEQKSDLDDIDKGCQKVLSELQRVLDKNSELSSSSGSFGRKFTRAWKRVRWDQDDINELRNRLSANISLLSAFNGRLTRDRVVRLVQHQEDQDRQAILDWFAPSDYASQQSDVLGRRQPGTGQWLLDSPEFRTWSRNGGQTLFCPGIPGAGKTVLTSVVIEELMSRSHTDSSIGLAYFYFHFRRREEQRPEKVLASILRQLLQKRVTLPDNVKTTYDSNKHFPMCVRTDILLKRLQSVIGLYSRVFIVIDALDEYDSWDRANFLDGIFELRAKTGLSFFTTSRFIPDITKYFEKDLSVEIRASEEDVRRYLKGHMSRLPTFVQRDPDIQEAIEMTIVNVVDGMFLLAQLHLDSLLGKRSTKAMYTALNKHKDQRYSTRKSIKASEAYDAAYDEAMSRVKSQVENARQLAEQVIFWITLAFRPLTTLELLHALASEIGSSAFDDTNISNVEDIASVCAGLVTIDEDSNVIRLVHYTTQEYFERTQKQWFPDAQANIALSCLAYLSFDDFEIGPSPNDDEFDARWKKYPLYDYAARNWGNHARNASAEIGKQILTFIKKKSKLAASVQAMTIQPVRFATAQKHGRSYTQDTIKEMGEVHVASYFGLESIVTTLMNEGYDVDSRCSNGRTPLSFAAEKGHEELVRTLLAVNNVNPDSKADVWMYYHFVTPVLPTADHFTFDGERTPLSFAADNGHTEIVKMLLATGGVDINSKTSGKFSRGRTPLSFAAGKGHDEVVKQLLAVDFIDADAKNSRGESPLFFAAKGDHSAVVQLLLATGNVDADAMNTGGWTPLTNAALNGYANVVKLLIETGNIDPDSKTTDDYCRGFTPLMWAAGGGHEAVVELLLATGKVDVNSRCERDGKTVLMMAAEEGQEGVVKMLLQTGKVEFT